MRPNLGAPALLLLAACSAGTTGTTTGSDGHNHSHGPQTLLSPAVAADEEPASSTVRVKLVATPHSFTVAETAVDGLAFNHQVPGPTIRARRGQLLQIDFENGLSTPSGLRLHGLDVPWSMDDGAPDVPPGGFFRYEVRLERSGTFWYHPRRDAARAIDLGLYGLLIVDEPGDPQPDSEVALVFDAFGETVPVTSTPGGDGHTGHSHADINRTWVVNGLLSPLVTVTAGTSIRARVLNASNAGYLALGLTTVSGGDGGSGADGGSHGGALEPLRQIAAGQGLLPSMHTHSPLIIAPGDRAEVELLIDAAERMLVTAPYSVNGGAGHGETTMLLDIQVTPSASDVAEPRPWPFVAAPPSADPGATDAVFVLQGEGDTWLVNGVAGPGGAPTQLPKAQPAVIEVRNVSSTLHPVHLHGAPFELLSIDGVSSRERTMLDTVNLAIGGRARLRVVGREAGPFRLECGSPAHAEAGMATLLHFGM